MTQTAASELASLLALALAHARREDPSRWVSLTIRDTKVSIRVYRTYTQRVQVLVAPRQGQPTQAQIDYIIKALGLRPYRQESLPLFGPDAAYLIVSDYYDTRDLDPHPSPV
jgi:hypothetical protein